MSSLSISASSPYNNILMDTRGEGKGSDVNSADSFEYIIIDDSISSLEITSGNNGKTFVEDRCFNREVFCDGFNSSEGFEYNYIDNYNKKHDTGIGNNENNIRNGNNACIDNNALGTVANALPHLLCRVRFYQNYTTNNNRYNNIEKNIYKYGSVTDNINVKKGEVSDNTGANQNILDWIECPVIENEDYPNEEDSDDNNSNNKSKKNKKIKVEIKYKHEIDVGVSKENMVNIKVKKRADRIFDENEDNNNDFSYNNTNDENLNYDNMNSENNDNVYDNTKDRNNKDNGNAPSTGNDVLSFMHNLWFKSSNETEKTSRLDGNASPDAAKGQLENDAGVGHQYSESNVDTRGCSGIVDDNVVDIHSNISSTIHQTISDNNDIILNTIQNGNSPTWTAAATADTPISATNDGTVCTSSNDLNGNHSPVSIDDPTHTDGDNSMVIVGAPTSTMETLGNPCLLYRESPFGLWSIEEEIYEEE